MAVTDHLDYDGVEVSDLFNIAKTNYGNSLAGLIRFMCYWISRTSKCTRLDNIYPVGSIYLSINATDPGELFGGEWERITDTFLYCATDSGKYRAGNSNGSKTVDITYYNLPDHLHYLQGKTGGNTGRTKAKRLHSDSYSQTNSAGRYYLMASQDDRDEATLWAAYTEDWGATASEREPLDIMPPSLSVYVWKRVE